MNIKKSLVEKYNTSDTLVMVTSYPKRGQIYSDNVGGIASFAKNTARHMSRPVIVLSEYFDKPAVYEEGNALVVHCFRKNTPWMWVAIYQALRHFTKTRKILIQYDFALYGDMIVSSLVLPFLGFIRILGYQPHIVLHGVVTDAFALSGHLGLTDSVKDKLKGTFLNYLFRQFYMMAGLFAKKVIVNEHALVSPLTPYIANNKLVAISHGVDTELTSVNKRHARQRLGIGKDEHVVLFFGFVNWFKGADIFVSSFSKISNLVDKKARFIVAGGESATLSQKKYYKSFFFDVFGQIEQSKSVEITGFVPAEKIADYFCASDIVVLPYRALIGASGVLSLVFSYCKPFIISDQLSSLCYSRDFQDALREVRLDFDDIVFPLTAQDCLARTQKVLKNGLKKKMILLAKLMAVRRNWQTTAHLYESTLFIYEYGTVPLGPLATSKALSLAK